MALGHDTEHLSMISIECCSEYGDPGLEVFNFLCVSAMKRFYSTVTDLARLRG